MGTSTHAVLPSNRRCVCLPLPKAKSFCLPKTGAIEIYLLDTESEGLGSLFGKGHARNCWFKKIRHSNQSIIAINSYLPNQTYLYCSSPPRDLFLSTGNAAVTRKAGGELLSGPHLATTGGYRCAVLWLPEPRGADLVQLLLAVRLQRSAAGLWVLWDVPWPTAVL